MGNPIATNGGINVGKIVLKIQSGGRLMGRLLGRMEGKMKILLGKHLHVDDGELGKVLVRGSRIHFSDWVRERNRKREIIKYIGRYIKKLKRTVVNHYLSMLNSVRGGRIRHNFLGTLEQFNNQVNYARRIITSNIVDDVDKEKMLRMLNYLRWRVRGITNSLSRKILEYYQSNQVRNYYRDDIEGFGRIRKVKVGLNYRDYRKILRLLKFIKSEQEMVGIKSDKINRIAEIIFSLYSRPLSNYYEENVDNNCYSSLLNNHHMNGFL